MSRPLPTKAGTATIVRVEMSPSDLNGLGGWIAALPEPRPDVDQAIRMIVAKHIRQWRSTPVAPIAE